MCPSCSRAEGAWIEPHIPKTWRDLVTYPLLGLAGLDRADHTRQLSEAGNLGAARVMDQFTRNPLKGTGASFYGYLNPKGFADRLAQDKDIPPGMVDYYRKLRLAPPGQEQSEFDKITGQLALGGVFSTLLPRKAEEAVGRWAR